MFLIIRLFTFSHLLRNNPKNFQVLTDDAAINDMVIILPSTMKKKKGNDEPIVVVDKQLLQTYLEQVKGHLHQLERLELRRFRGNRFLLVDKSDGTELSRLMTPGEMYSRLYSLSQLLYTVHTAKINHYRRMQEALQQQEEQELDRQQ